MASQQEQATGKIVEIIGAVVDVEFPAVRFLKFMMHLRIESHDVTLEVQQQLGDGIVRTIAMG